MTTIYVVFIGGPKAGTHDYIETPLPERLGDYRLLGIRKGAGTSHWVKEQGEYRFEPLQ